MTRKKTTLDHHLMISMICEYNSFRDYASRPQTQQNEDIAAFCAIRAVRYCEDAGYDPQSLITDAYEFVMQINSKMTAVSL